MKAFVTGGTGFIGQHLVEQLVERGYEVQALVRDQKGSERMRSLGAEPVLGDVTNRESMRSAMTGSQLVFHMAAWYKLGGGDSTKAEQINLEGTRNVLELAAELGVPHIIYTSTVGVFGDTHGAQVDESYHMPAGQPFLTDYDRTKWRAHYEVAVPLISKGAPIIIVMPGPVFGPGDTSLVGQLLEAYMRGFLVFFPGPETSLSCTYVDDIAEGHILAAEKGRPGESYILTGEAYSLRDMAQLWARISGKPLPLAYVPARWLKPLSPLADLWSRILHKPELFNADSLAVLGVTYTARSDKARRELGWQPRPVEEGFRETLEAMAVKVQAEPILTPYRKRNLVFALCAAAFLYLLSRRRKPRWRPFLQR